MTIKQLSIFIENKGGTLIKVLDLLSKANIQMAFLYKLAKLFYMCRTATIVYIKSVGLGTDNYCLCA